MQRFWDQATYTAQDTGWAILLDGKPMRLPNGGALTLTTEPLAAAIAAEWQQAGGGKGGTMGPHHVPLTGLAGTAQNHVARNPSATIDSLAAYGETDLLCYRAIAPEPLIKAQAAAWQPWLDWSALVLDAPLLVTSGIIHIAQPPDALAALRRALARLSVPDLAALGVIVPSLGSLVLGLAVARGDLAIADAHHVATVDERFQAEFWGADAEAAERQARIAADLAVAAEFMRLSRAEYVKDCP